MSRSRWMLLGPGLLLAATGVGGGDLATGAFVGGLLGPTVLWAVIVGAALKYVVTEGLARWQLATGETFIEAVVSRAGPVVVWLFLPYLILWSFFVGSAQMSATGVTLHAIVPYFADATTGKIFFGVLSGLAGIALVLIGGYQLFEALMRICIGLMFITVVATAVLLWPGTGVVLEGLLVPRLSSLDADSVRWTVALIGGVGGTVTVLCYGYWLREEGFEKTEDLGACRFDLGLGYSMTALFGLAMVIVGSTVTVEGSGAALLVELAQRLESELGVYGRWLFLLGAFGAVFSSLLGVWQSVPYLFAECYRQLRGISAPVSTSMPAYRLCLLALGIVPMVGLFVSFRQIQQLYALIGAWFFPALAVALLIFGGSARWTRAEQRNGPLTTILLVGVVVFFLWAGFWS